MITLLQAKQLRIGEEIHSGACRVQTGPRGGKSYFITRFRVNGKIKLWKRRPEKFMLPIKYGMWFWDALTDQNAHRFHIAEECPVCESK